MILINLLPHREVRRQQRKQAFFAGLGFSAVVGAAICAIWYTGVSTLIEIGRRKLASEQRLTQPTQPTQIDHSDSNSEPDLAPGSPPTTG